MTKAEYDERIASLKSRYRYLFAGKHLGHDIAPGWLTIVEELCRHIDETLAAAEKRRVYFTQIKEKFGGLRAYLNVTPLRVDILSKEGEILSGHLAKKSPRELVARLAPLIHVAEETSHRTCALCGAPGQLRTDRHWFLTLCDKHVSANMSDLDGRFEELTAP